MATRKKKEPLDPAELRILIRQAVEKADLPLKATAVGKALPKAWQAPAPELLSILESLAAEGMLFLWPAAKGPGSFAKYSTEHAAREAILSSLKEPLGQAKLLAAAAKRFPKGLAAAAAKSLLTRTLTTLQQEQVVTLLPPRKTALWTLLEAAPASPDTPFADLRHRFPHLNRAQARLALEQAFRSNLTIEERIEDAILNVEPQARTGGLAWLPEVRKHLVPAVPKPEFDAAVLSLARSGVLTLHEFMGNLQANEQERQALVFDGKELYYGGVSFRRE